MDVLPSARQRGSGDVRRAIDWVAQSVNGDPRVAEDAARLKKILAMDPVELCKRQCGK